MHLLTSDKSGYQLSALGLWLSNFNVSREDVIFSLSVMLLLIKLSVDLCKAIKYFKGDKK